MEIKEIHELDTVGSDSERLSVAQRLPKRAEWLFDGQVKQIACTHGLIVKYIEPNVFVIEAPYIKILNRAYILSPSGFLIEELPKRLKDDFLIYYDVIKNSNVIDFLAASSGTDFRVSVDAVSGAVVDVKFFK